MNCIISPEGKNDVYSWLSMCNKVRLRNFVRFLKHQQEAQRQTRNRGIRTPNKTSRQMHEAKLSTSVKGPVFNMIYDFILIFPMSYNTKYRW